MGLCLKCGFKSDKPFKNGCPKCGYDPAKEWAKATNNAIDELWNTFEKQGHSVHSAYVTMVSLIQRYFENNLDPAWIVSKSPAIVTIGGPQELDIIPLNEKAKQLKISVSIDQAKET